MQPIRAYIYIDVIKIATLQSKSECNYIHHLNIHSVEVSLPLLEFICNSEI